MLSRQWRMAISLAAMSLPSIVAAQSTPQTGQAVLQQMHDKYKGKWYHTLTFTQKTVMHRPDGSTQDQVWYESLRHSADGGTRLRIDFGNPSGGNGALYTSDSLYSVRAGKVVKAVGKGNEFLPLIEGVYLQPVERTVKDLAGMRVDLTTVSTGTWQDRPVWIVGASGGDLGKPQFWVEQDRLVLTRMLIDLGGELLDVDLSGYVPVKGAWLATRISMSSGGKAVQSEEYTDWNTERQLSPALLDATQWSSAPHWVKP